MKKVVATKLGFYGNTRVKPGEVFMVPDGLKAKWFKEVGDKAIKVTPVRKEPDTLSALTKLAAKSQMDLVAEKLEAASVFDEDVPEPVKPVQRSPFSKKKGDSDE